MHWGVHAYPITDAELEKQQQLRTLWYVLPNLIWEPVNIFPILIFV